MTKWQDILEQAIIGKLVAAFIDDGWRVELSDQDGGGLFLYAVPDAGDKPNDGYKYWVRLVLGNGADVISDYTTNLERLLEPVNKFAAEWQD